MNPRTGSRTQFDRAVRVIPGGVNSPARAFGGVGRHPIWIDRADGSYLFDVDSNRYLDCIGSWGPFILGHRHPAVIDALQQALERGTSYGAPTERETELAELIVAGVPSVEKVRMVNSGTEATMSAVRVARGYTGRDLVIKFAGCYHGHVDALLVQAGSAATTLGTPSSPGIPAGATKDTLVLPFNDHNAVRAEFARRGDAIAAVILEPVVGNMGCVPPLEGFLELLRELCTRYGSVLIFDEVMTGFRLAFGGAQELFGVTPDMTALGKIIGGGLPVGAYGGRADIMDCVSPAGPVYQAGTLSGNPLAMAAGLATLTQLRDDPPYERLDAIGARLQRALTSSAERHGIPHVVQRVGSMITLFFNPDPVINYDDATRSDTARFAKFFWGLADRGVYWPCSQYEAAFLAASHTDDHIDTIAAAADESLAGLA